VRKAWEAAVCELVNNERTLKYFPGAKGERCVPDPGYTVLYDSPRGFPALFRSTSSVPKRVDYTRPPCTYVPAVLFLPVQQAPPAQHYLYLCTMYMRDRTSTPGPMPVASDIKSDKDQNGSNRGNAAHKQDDALQASKGQPQSNVRRLPGAVMARCLTSAMSVLSSSLFCQVTPSRARASFPARSIVVPLPQLHSALGYECVIWSSQTLVLRQDSDRTPPLSHLVLTFHAPGNE
jgi:hypothetical protein